MKCFTQGHGERWVAQSAGTPFFLAPFQQAEFLSPPLPCSLKHRTPPWRVAPPPLPFLQNFKKKPSPAKLSNRRRLLKPGKELRGAARPVPCRPASALSASAQPCVALAASKQAILQRGSPPPPSPRPPPTGPTCCIPASSSRPSKLSRGGLQAQPVRPRSARARAHTHAEQPPPPFPIPTLPRSGSRHRRSPPRQTPQGWVRERRGRDALCQPGRHIPPLPSPAGSLACSPARATGCSPRGERLELGGRRAPP